MPLPAPRRWRRSSRSPCACSLAPRVRLQVVGLGGEADHQPRPPRRHGRRASARMSGFSTSAHRRRALAALLQLDRRAPASGRQSATAATQTATSAGSAASQRRQHLRAVSTSTRVDARRRRQRRRPGDQGHLARRRGQRRGDGVALLAARAVGDEPHRVDRLARRAGGHQHALARRAAARAGQRSDAIDRGEDRLRLGHPARAELAAGHVAVVRADETRRRPPCSVAMLRWVAGCSHIRTFIAGATSTGLSVASSVVEARSSARPSAAIFAIRSAVAGRHDHQVGRRATARCGPSRASSVRRRARNRPCPRTARPATAGSRTRAPAAVRIGRTATPALRKRRDQLERLVGRHAAADDQKHAPLGQSPDPPENAPALIAKVFARQTQLRYVLSLFRTTLG